MKLGRIFKPRSPLEGVRAALDTEAHNVVFS